MKALKLGLFSLFSPLFLWPAVTQAQSFDIALFESPFSLFTNETGTWFVATETNDENAFVSFIIDFGDGNSQTAQFLGLKRFTHSFDRPGNYVVTIFEGSTKAEMARKVVKVSDRVSCAEPANPVCENEQERISLGSDANGCFLGFECRSITNSCPAPARPTECAESDWVRIESLDGCDRGYRCATDSEKHAGCPRFNVPNCASNQFMVFQGFDNNGCSKGLRCESTVPKVPGIPENPKNLNPENPNTPEPDPLNPSCPQYEVPSCSRGILISRGFDDDNCFKGYTCQSFGLGSYLLKPRTEFLKTIRERVKKVQRYKSFKRQDGILVEDKTATQNTTTTHPNSGSGVTKASRSHLTRPKRVLRRTNTLLIDRYNQARKALNTNTTETSKMSKAELLRKRTELRKKLLAKQKAVRPTTTNTRQTTKKVLPSTVDTTTQKETTSKNNLYEDILQKLRLRKVESGP